MGRDAPVLAVVLVGAAWILAHPKHAIPMDDPAVSARKGGIQGEFFRGEFAEKVL